MSFALGLITGGRLGDIFGRKRILLIGIAGFTLTSALADVPVEAASSASGLGTTVQRVGTALGIAATSDSRVRKRRTTL